MKKLFLLLFVTFFATVQLQVFAQDKGVFNARKGNRFINKIIEETNKFNKKNYSAKKYFEMDFSDYKLPQSIDEFKTAWHNNPISQGLTGTCWAFSTTSYFESEVYRLTGEKVKLSEMWTAYWEYVEKAKGFISTRGRSLFSQGSEANAVTRVWKKYGVVPEVAYTGLLKGQVFHNHDEMFSEMKGYLKGVKERNQWNEEIVLETIKSIMNNYMGTPPAMVSVDGKEMTSKEYLNDYLKLNLNDYADILSYMQKPYWQQVEYEVADNWWHSEDYYNVPLDVYMEIIKKAVKEGYTLAIGGDVSEPGYNAYEEVAIVPSFDIPAKNIDENARQFRFSNGTTTDDHGIHIVGYKVGDNDKLWFLIKDSGSGSRDGKNKGYYFYHEDYVKLKIMDFMVHKSVVEDILKKFKK